jgi:hypothetical protein
MGVCLSGISIILIIALLIMVNNMTINDVMLSNIIVLGGLLFYINQRYWTGCTYPDYNNP